MGELTCIMWVLQVFIVGLEISENVLLGQETSRINTKYGDFMEYSLDNKQNYHSDYPYLTLKGQYLCKEDSFLTAKTFKELDKLSFSNPGQIREDLGAHSEKWRNSYLWAYWGIWGTQIATAIFLFIILFLTFLLQGQDAINFVVISVSSLGYSAILSWKLHLYLTAGFLQSAFIIFKFDDQCISSQNPL